MNTGIYVSNGGIKTHDRLQYMKQYETEPDAIVTGFGPDPVGSLVCGTSWEMVWFLLKIFHFYMSRTLLLHLTELCQPHIEGQETVIISPIRIAAWTLCL